MAMATAPATAQRYLVLCHISKANNVRQLVRVGLAYGFAPVLVGATTFRDEVAQLLREFDCPQPLLEFPKLAEAKDYLYQRSIPLIGIEILEGAHSVLDFAFPESFALMPGNEGTGLNEKQKALSDAFVYIPQYGSGTASLNVHVATTLVLHKAQPSARPPSETACSR